MKGIILNLNCRDEPLNVKKTLEECGINSEQKYTILYDFEPYGYPLLD